MVVKGAQFETAKDTSTIEAGARPGSPWRVIEMHVKDIKIELCLILLTVTRDHPEPQQCREYKVT